jgi:hypothetical protein
MKEKRKEGEGRKAKKKKGRKEGRRRKEGRKVKEKRKEGREVDLHGCWHWSLRTQFWHFNLEKRKEYEARNI